MKNLFVLLAVVITLLVVSCQSGREPEPSSLTASDSLRLQLSGVWQSETIMINRYTNSTLTGSENTSMAETYTLHTDGNFKLSATGGFTIKGKWNLNRSGDQLVVATDEGGIMEWQIQSLSDKQLVLYSSQTTMIGERAERLETWVNCIKAAQ